MLTIFVLSIVILCLKKILALRGEHVPGSQIVRKTRKAEAGGWDGENGKRKGERACNQFFYDALPPTFGTFEIIRFSQEPIN